MRQETGSRQKPVKSKDIISVRIHQNGDAFVLPEVRIDAASNGDDAKVLSVELLSKRTMLVPRELITLDAASSAEEVCRREYAAAGMSVGQNEELLVLGDGEIVALVAVAKAMLVELNGRRAAELLYTTPLLRDRVSDESHVVVDVMDGLSFIKVYSSSELLFADVFETSSTAQTAYWLQRLSAAMSLGDYDLYMYRGESALLSVVSSSFKQLRRCE